MSLLKEHDDHVAHNGMYSASIWELVSVDGMWLVEVCNQCDNITHITCQHTINKWNEEGTVLTCQSCGADGT